MKPAFKSVCDNINQLITGLSSDLQRDWDVRFGFIAFNDSPQPDGGHLHGYVGVNGAGIWHTLYHSRYDSAEMQTCFTKDVSVFKRALMNVRCEGEEMHLLALDFALDFPWRASATCHRAVVLLSDEAFETGVFLDFQKEQLPRLIDKVTRKAVQLHIIAPESPVFFELAEIDKSTYAPLPAGDKGLQKVNFSDLMRGIGNSISASTVYGGGETAPMPLYEQEQWVAGDGTPTKD